MSCLGYGEKVGGLRLRFIKIFLVVDEIWYILCDVVSGWRVIMRILSNIGDYFCSRSFVNLLFECEFFKFMINVVCCWVVMMIGMKGMIVLNIRVGLIIFRGGGVGCCEGWEGYFDFFLVDVILWEVLFKCCWVMGELVWMLVLKLRVL